MRVYLIRNKKRGKFVDYVGNVEGERGFDAPLYLYTLQDALSVVNDFGSDEYEVFKDIVVPMIFQSTPESIESLSHHPYIIKSWLSQSDVLECSEKIFVQIEVPRFYEDEMERYYMRTWNRSLTRISDYYEDDIKKILL